MKTKVLDFKKLKENSGAFKSEESQAYLVYRKKTEPEVDRRDLGKKRLRALLKRKKKDRKSRRSKNVLLVSILLLITILGISTILFTNYIVLPARNINKSVNRILDIAYALGNDMKTKDVSRVDSYFDSIQLELDNIDAEINRYDFLKKSKYTRGYYENLQIGREMIRKSDALVTKSLPQFKVALESSGFKVEEGSPPPIIEGDEDSAFALIIKQIPEYLAFYEVIEPDVIDIMADFRRLDPEYIPNLPGKDMKKKYAETIKYLDKYPETSTKVKEFVAKMPQLIGANQPTDYMIVLQNETEMRSSGGLLTAVGNARITEGEIGEMENLKDMWDLQYYMWQLVSEGLIYEMPYYNIYGQLYLMNSGCGGSEARAQDVGMYPDLHTSMDMFKDYYDIASYYDPETYPPYDHIMILNHHSGEKIISLIEPLHVEGFGDVTSENLFEFIKAETDDAEKYNGGLDSDRKSIIGEVANAAKDKFFDLPLTEMPKVIDTIIKLFYGKDIAFYSKDQSMQTYFDRYGLSGRQEREFAGDYFHLNEAQNCSLKLNKFVRDSVEMNVNISEDGSITKAVQVHWWQPQVYNDSLAKFYDKTLRFRYRAWVRLFTPPGSYNFDSDGYEKSISIYSPVAYWPQEYYDDVPNKEISDNIIQFDHRRLSESDPVAKQDLNVSYNLPDSINYNKDGSYKLLIQKHPGKSWSDGYEEYTININHKGTNSSIKFALDRDKVLTYKNGVITIDNFEQDMDWILDLVDTIPFEKLSSSK